MPGTAGRPRSTVPRSSGSAPSQPAPTKPGLHQVKAGANLWTIARSELADATGRNPAELRAGEVAAYWVRIVAANRARLRSGNPDLIYPGEYVRLPAVRRSS